MNKKFWKDKRVLITGYEGFLGSNLTKKLITTEAKVTGIDIKFQRGNTALAKTDYNRIIPIKGDIVNYNLVNKIIKKYKIEAIFHLAAEALVGKCFKNPLKAFSNNIRGTWNVLEAARKSDTVKAIIVASSDKAYGSHKKLPYKENASLQGKHPYDVSKSCADLIAYTYFHTYGLPVAITRCGNVYGPGDYNFSRIVPDAIRCALLGKTLLIRSDGRFTRDYIFVEDIVEGYILLAEKLNNLRLSGEAFNLSDENPLTVIGLVKEIRRLTNKKLKYRILNQAKYEIKHQYLSSLKARKFLGWKPAYTLEKGLKKTILWYKNSFKHK